MHCCSYSPRMSWHCWLSNGIYSTTFANSIINHTWWTPFVSWQTRNTVMPFTTLRPAFICHSSKHADINTHQVHIPVGVYWCKPLTFLACSQADQQHVRSLHEVLLQMSPYFACALHVEVNMWPLTTNPGSLLLLTSKLWCLYRTSCIFLTNVLQLLTDKVVVLARLKLQPSRLWCERPKCDGEVHQFIWLITDRDDPGIWVRDPTRVVFFLWYL